jgi:tRNA pseudouridine55 synthase
VIDGLVIVDKPAGCTSHDVVARCRRIFGQRRVGHAGTLDPDATGVLLVGLGRATRLMQFLTGLPKTYSGEIVLGVATSTLDSSGEITGRWDMSRVTLDDVRAAALGLTGTISQVPPMVSALKVGGRRLHELAREGVEVERAPRTVVVERFELHQVGRPDAGDPSGAVGGRRTPVFAFLVECSTGTYVRSLAADLGTALEGGAHLRRLRRTAVGPWSEEEAVALDDLGPGSVVAPAGALRGIPAVRVADGIARAVTQGKVLDRAVLAVSGDGPWPVLSETGRLLAVYEPYADGRAKPAVVIATAEP